MPDSKVLILGSGVIGLSCALRLARVGHAVQIVDPHPASGASYVAAGMLAPVTEATYGEEALAKLCLKAATRWPAFAEEVEACSGRRIGYLTDGTLLVGALAGDHEFLVELYGFHQQLGLTSRLCGPSESLELEPTLSPRLRGGIFAPQDHQVDNRALLAGLWEALRATRVQIIEAEGRIELVNGALAGVRTASALHVADAVVLAAGYHSPKLLPSELRDELPIRPVKGQILRLELANPALRPSITVRGIVNGRSTYIVPRAAGRLVVGATVEEQGEDARVTAGATRELLDDATAVLPSLGEAELLEASVGFRPATPDNVAIVGPSSVKGLYYAAGHYRNGILFAPLTAEVLAESIASESQARDSEAFAPVRFFR